MQVKSGLNNTLQSTYKWELALTICYNPRASENRPLRYIKIHVQMKVDLYDTLRSKYKWICI